MGACDFTVKVKAKDARDAFNKAVGDAQWEHGHGGYTGTIAEKSEYQAFEMPAGMDTETLLQHALYGNPVKTDPPAVFRMAELANDKWGPAVCVKVAEGTFLFFGMASS